MRLIKLAILSIIFFALLITGISLFFPSHIRISKAINIAAGRETILGEVNDISKWKNWYPGFDTLTLQSPVRKEGRVVTAVSAGIPIAITASVPGEVKASFRPGKKKTVYSGWRTVNYQHTDSTTVQWYMDFHLNWYPWEKFSSLLLEKNYGPLMEKGLENLKALLEK